MSEYVCSDSAFDEVRADSGEIREGYQRFVGTLEKIGRSEFSRRWTQAKRVLRENGIAYSGYASSARPRTWTLDALPMLVDGDEWKQIKAAIGQRAELLNLILRDVYGPQQLVRDRVLPRALVHSDPRLSRECIGTTPPENCWLQLYASDLARSSDGRWWVLADRTEAPSGMGYALEHRVVTSRMIPESFRNLNVMRLAPFFAAMQERLRHIAPHNRDNPRTVLLSDGVENPYHLEDAYLARYLGYQLVEDGDLAVRKRKVMLKTLGGLQPVDVIFRHQNSHDSDPLVYESVAGIAGLSQAARANEVAILNPLGSGLLESAAYMAFMPQLCRALLGQDLMMPNIATWWCGDRQSLSYVLSRLEELDVKPAFRRRGKDESLRARIRNSAPSELAEMIQANPGDFVAQERLERSNVPTWGKKLRMRKAAVRCYAVAEQQKYVVMDGGLGRVTKTNEPLESTIGNGEKSKDVWILSDSDIKYVTLLENTIAPTGIMRHGVDLPSRVADNLFWLGRSLERAECHARLVNVVAARLSGETANSESVVLPMLLRCLAKDGLIEAGYAVDELRKTMPDIGDTLIDQIFDTHQSDSLRSSLDNLVRIGSTVRDRLSVQAWTSIQRIDDGFRLKKRGRMSSADIMLVTDDLLGQLSSIAGIVMESMTRTHVYQFLDLGRRMERAVHTIGLLANGVLISNKPPRAVLEATLELTVSLMTYRNRYLASMHAAGVLDLIVTDESNPRSLAYQLVRIRENVDALPLQNNDSSYTQEQRLAMAMVAEVRMLEWDNTICFGDEQAKQLLEWEKTLLGLSQLISHRYLIHASVPQQLSEIEFP